MAMPEQEKESINKTLQCPQCGCPEAEPTWPSPDEDNKMEYCCSECGEYFIDEAEQLHEIKS